jgi:YcaO-like protein with predicted kinase domain
LVIKVYAGLSAQRSDVHSILPGALYAPPIKRDDILADIKSGVSSILILDGLFHQALSVSPSEIMDAIRRGIRVFGASSMGALRAAELEAYGMVGVGEIFEHIRDADAFRDDFLGQVFVDGWPQVQEASVTYVEFAINLKSLLRRRRISRKTCEYLCALYADLHYAERNLPTLTARIRDAHRNPDELLHAANHALNTMTRPKQSDARKAMRFVSRYHDQVASLNSALRHPLNGSSSKCLAKRRAIAAQVGASPELGAAYPAIELLPTLERSESISYRENGNRTAQPRDVLKELDRLMPLVGATRLAEISQLAVNRMPVYQSTRPVPFGHTLGGTTTGAQGKGSTNDQARISCLAETVEGYCLEPRNENLIRASYGFLRDHRAVADPRQFTRAIGTRPVRVSEPLMWTEALCLEQKSTVLVPAELVFFDFFATDYATRGAFPCSTHGAGSGTTHLEAATHALYECIEGHYEAAIRCDTLRPRRLRHPFAEKADRDEFDIRLYTVLIPGIENMPFAFCIVETADTCYFGSGCFSSLDTAVARAVSEAIQAISASYSGSREDLDQEEDDDDWDPQNYAQRSISCAEYRSRVVSHKFNDLRAEYRFLLRWLHAAGFPLTYLANLTRRGIEFPVVKAIVPGIHSEPGVRYTSDYSSKDANRHAYGVR